MVNAVIAELVLAGATYRFPDKPGTVSDSPVIRHAKESRHHGGATSLRT